MKTSHGRLFYIEKYHVVRRESNPVLLPVNGAVFARSQVLTLWRVQGSLMRWRGRCCSRVCAGGAQLSARNLKTYGSIQNH